jgi:uncharacterized protein
MRPLSENRKKREAVKISQYDKGLHAAAAKLALTLCGCWGKARRAAGNIKLTRLQFSFDNLPAAFEGKRILFLSDLHFPGVDGFSEKLESIIETIEFDYCFLGGDYSNGTGANPHLVNPALKRLINSIKAKTEKIYGVLGNHDIYSTAVFLESLGVKMLLNDNTKIAEGCEYISLVGVDDEYHFRNTDWNLAEEELDKNSFRIVLSHSPDNFAAAAQRNYDLMLSGHTHGGQICLPFGIPVVTHTKVKGKYVRGSWNAGKMRGYTSYGCGTSPIGARFFAEPEICLITLKG